MVQLRDIFLASLLVGCTGKTLSFSTPHTPPKKEMCILKKKKIAANISVRSLQQSSGLKASRSPPGSPLSPRPKAPCVAGAAVTLTVLRLMLISLLAIRVSCFFFVFFLKTACC